MKNYVLLVGTAVLALGCATATAPLSLPDEPEKVPAQEAKSPITVARSPKVAKSAETRQRPFATPQDDAQAATPVVSGDAPLQKPTAPEELAVLVVQSGALITQVNGDSSLRCMQPECRIPLPPGTHRVAVKYRDTAKRGGSTVTYSSMYPRIVEINLEPGHQYAVTASGRYSHKWWISIEDQTTNKTVYDDRDKNQ